MTRFLVSLKPRFSKRFLVSNQKVSGGVGVNLYISIRYPANQIKLWFADFHGAKSAIA